MKLIYFPEPSDGGIAVSFCCFVITSYISKYLVKLLISQTSEGQLQNTDRTKSLFLIFYLKARGVVKERFPLIYSNPVRSV